MLKGALGTFGLVDSKTKKIENLIRNLANRFETWQLICNHYYYSSCGVKELIMIGACKCCSHPDYLSDDLFE